MIQFGIETEFGIQSEADAKADVVAESIALVRSAVNLGVFMRWDYGCEDPHADARGFRVDALRQDVDEANYEEEDSRRILSFPEIKSDMVLPNGARFYNDHAHPEYCTPECSTLEEMVAQDRAGELLVMACAERLRQERGHGVRLYKNNTDYAGHSYGCHENYLVPRALEWVDLARGIQAFLVTRQVFTGAGKYGVEEEDRFLKPGFQISQRADFFSELESVDTMQRRPLINTRDEPHANALRYRRFHVILGDANMVPFATALKVGTTALVLEALCRRPLASWPVLRDPLGAVVDISRSPGLGGTYQVEGVGRMTALDVQERYWGMVRGEVDLDSPWKRWVLEQWEEIITDLRRDPEVCLDRVDWVAKRALIRQFQESEGIEDSDPWLRSLDLEYHGLDLESGLFYGLERAGWFRPVAGDRVGQEGLLQAPRTTRAAVRGLLVHRFASSILSAQWDHVTLRTRRGTLKISLMDVFDAASVERLRAGVEAASDPDELWSLYDKPCV